MFNFHPLSPQTRCGVPRKEVADDPAYQPTIPLTRINMEEYSCIADDCDSDLVDSNATDTRVQEEKVSALLEVVYTSFIRILFANLNYLMLKSYQV